MPFAACQVKVISPNAKFIVFLRDPVERAYSGLTHAANMIRYYGGHNDPVLKETFWQGMRHGLLDLASRPKCDFQTGTP